ncbi:hypothetical protein RBB50_012725 [Rhinocladiella similis]
MQPHSEAFLDISDAGKSRACHVAIDQPLFDCAGIFLACMEGPDAERHAACLAPEDQNRMLFDQNNEKVSRTSIKPTVVGTAKIMGYDDVLEAHRKREAKEAAATNRTRRGHKRPPSIASIEEKRMRLTEIEKGKQEVEAWGLGDYCSILALS